MGTYSSKGGAESQPDPYSRTGPADQNFGANPALNQQLAHTFGFDQDFGSGNWGQFSQGLNQQQQDAANNIINNPAAYDNYQDMGTNTQLNTALRDQFGYGGDFGDGGWQAYQASLPPEQQALAQQMIANGGVMPGASLGDQALQGLGGAQDWMAQWAQYQPGNLATMDRSPYQNPYQQDVIDASMNEMNRQNTIQQNALGDQAMGAGAFGGDRHGIAQAEMNRNLADQQQRWLAGFNADMFNDSTQQGMFDIGNQFQNKAMNMGAGMDMANLANMGFGWDQQIKQNMMQAGGMQQQQMQQLIDSAKQQYGGIAGWPQGQTNFYGGAMPSPGGGGTQTSGSTPGVMDWLGLALKGYGAYASGGTSLLAG